MRQFVNFNIPDIFKLIFSMPDNFTVLFILLIVLYFGFLILLYPLIFSFRFLLKFIHDNNINITLKMTNDIFTNYLVEIKILGKIIFMLKNFLFILRDL
jgi:hypothetical protein